MPPSWRAGTWLLYFLIQVNYLTAFAFNLALGNPSVRDNDSIMISCRAGEMVFRRLGPDSYTLSLRLLGGETAFNFDHGSSDHTSCTTRETHKFCRNYRRVRTHCYFYPTSTCPRPERSSDRTTRCSFPYSLSSLPEPFGERRDLPRTLWRRDYFDTSGTRGTT